MGEVRRGTRVRPGFSTLTGQRAFLITACDASLRRTLADGEYVLASVTGTGEHVIYAWNAHFGHTDRILECALVPGVLAPGVLGASGLT